MEVLPRSLPLASPMFSNRQPHGISLPYRRRGRPHARWCSDGIAEKIHQSHPTGGNRIALSFYSDFDYKISNHNLWTVDDIGCKKGASGRSSVEHLMQFQRDAYFQTAFDSWTLLVTQPSQGLNLSVTAACIRVLNLQYKDAVRLPRSWGLEMDSWNQTLNQQSASMEYCQRTGRYKVVRMLKTSERGPGGRGYKYRCETYTLGTNAAWETAKPPPAYRLVLNGNFSLPILAHGAHHWLDRSCSMEDYYYQVVAFNANEGSYKLTPFKADRETLHVSCMFRDVDSGNVCLSAVLLEDFPGMPCNDDRFPVELWMLEANRSTDVASNSDETWVKKWEGYLPEEAAFPVVMEGQKLLFWTLCDSLCWYDLNSMTVQIVADRVQNKSEASYDDSDYRPLLDMYFSPSVAFFDHEVARPEILHTERQIISYQGLPRNCRCW